MKKSGLGKLYDCLTPEERFRLVIEAEARGDGRETEWLVRSAPRYTYQEADPAYTSLARASKDLTWAVYLGLLPRLAEMQIARAFSGELRIVCVFGDGQKLKSICACSEALLARGQGPDTLKTEQPWLRV